MPAWPNLFLVGAPRCGTTSLYAYLADHPRVFGPVEKEPHFYDRDVLGPGGPTRDEYAAMYADAGDERWLLDASTLYLYSSDAPAAVKRDSPDAHVIIALRDPVELVASWHSLLVASGAETIVDLGAAIDAEGEGSLLLRYTDVGGFARHVERWQDEFGSDRVHLVLLEELERRPEEAMNRLLDALGLEKVDGHVLPHLNQARRTRATSVLVQLNKPSRARAVVKAVVPRPVRRYAWRGVTSMLTPPGERPPVDPSIRHELEGRFLLEHALVGRLRTPGPAPPAPAPVPQAANPV